MKLKECFQLMQYSEFTQHFHNFPQCITPLQKVPLPNLAVCKSAEAADQLNKCITCQLTKYLRLMSA
jgi:hypothetical protein